MNPSQTNERTTSEHIAHFNGRIIDENNRFARSNELKNERMLTIVQSDIAAEQFDTFHELLSTATAVPYEEIGSRALALEADIRSVEAAELSASAQLLSDAELAISLAPRKAEDIEKVKSDILEQSRRNSLTSLRSELDKIYASLSEYGTDWGIPQAIPPMDRGMLYGMILENTERKETETSFEDIIPLTPEERASIAETADRAQYAIENPDASRHIVFYLAENLNKVVTVEELARFLYTADVTGDNHRSHVTTLLGPKIQGKRIQRMLHEEHGLDLQYGIRILRQEDDKKRMVEVRRTRIYRVVEPNTVDKELRSVIETVLSENKTVIDEFEQTVPEKQPDIPLAVVTEEILAVESLDHEVEHGEDWHVEFEAAVIFAINRLKEDNLFSDDLMRGSAVRSMSSSNLLGTKTNRERMHNAGLLKVGQLKSDEMTREQRVLGLLFNTNSHVLTQKTSRKQALEIVQRCIQENLES